MTDILKAKIIPPRRMGAIVDGKFDPAGGPLLATNDGSIPLMLSAPGIGLDADDELRIGIVDRQTKAKRGEAYKTECLTRDAVHAKIMDAWNNHDRLRAVNAELTGQLRGWLAYADAELSEFDVPGDTCDPDGQLCQKCESAGCIQLRIRETRRAIARARGE